MEAKKKITVADIAKKAGVSPATVSRVLNQRTDLVTEKTIRLVEDTLLACNYKLPEKKEDKPQERPVILCNMPSLQNIFYTEVIQGMVSSAGAHGCHLIFNQMPLDYGSLQDFISLIKRVNAVGLIILNKISTEILQKINEIIPIIQCSEYNPDSHIPYVSVLNNKATQEAIRYLISIGRNKIAFINGPISFTYAKEREKGFLTAMENAHLHVPRNWIVHLPDINHEMAYAAACQILNSDVIPNAFFTASDTLAAATLRACRRYHYNVPRDIAVVGFDNTELATLCTPSITSVSQPAFQIGFSACEMLLERIASPSDEPRSLLLETELIIRESSRIPG